ncbi:MAG: hypothetical protein K1Y02_16155 [Candidatus Hydrogenedentes bacterium]|nr:hypothetical protein [Candidatus Hydrogenedentota bacterium]
MTIEDRLNQQQYMIRKKIFKIFGEAFHIYDFRGTVLFYSKLKAFKLKEDIRLYTGEDMTTEVLTIKARKMIDLWSTYDVYDSQTQRKVGTFRRKGLKSILKDEWIIMDDNDREIGLVQEDSMMMALLRRFLTNLIPQQFSGSIGGQAVLHFKRHFNPFVLRMDLNFSMDTAGLLDRRMGLAAGILISAIEGRQSEM